MEAWAILAFVVVNFSLLCWEGSKLVFGVTWERVWFVYIREALQLLILTLAMFWLAQAAHPYAFTWKWLELSGHNWLELQLLFDLKNTGILLLAVSVQSARWVVSAVQSRSQVTDRNDRSTDVMGPITNLVLLFNLGAANEVTLLVGWCFAAMALWSGEYYFCGVKGPQREYKVSGILLHFLSALAFLYLVLIGVGLFSESLKGLGEDVLSLVFGMILIPRLLSIRVGEGDSVFLDLGLTSILLQGVTTFCFFEKFLQILNATFNLKAVAFGLLVFSIVLSLRQMFERRISGTLHLVLLQVFISMAVQFLLGIPSNALAVVGLGIINTAYLMIVALHFSEAHQIKNVSFHKFWALSSILLWSPLPVVGLGSLRFLEMLPAINGEILQRSDWCLAIVKVAADTLVSFSVTVFVRRVWAQKIEQNSKKSTSRLPYFTFVFVCMATLLSAVAVLWVTTGETNSQALTLSFDEPKLIAFAALGISNLFYGFLYWVLNVRFSQSFFDLMDRLETRALGFGNVCMTIFARSKIAASRLISLSDEYWWRLCTGTVRFVGIGLKKGIVTLDEEAIEKTINQGAEESLVAVSQSMQLLHTGHVQYYLAFAMIALMAVVTKCFHLLGG